MNKCEKPLKIGNVTLPNSLILAPMAGYTDYAMRRLCALSGVGLTVTEMVSAKGLTYNPDKSGELLITAPEEKIKSVQLFGHEPEFFVKALESGLTDKFDIIDINMGCPVPKIVKSGEGSALMKTPELAESIVRACVKSANGRPVTVKTRLGFSEDENIAVEFCSRMQDAGAAAVAVHGRTRAMGYSGTSDIEAIARVREALDIPVIASGDANQDNAESILERADGLMIGRAALGDPQIFARLLGKENSLTLKQTLLLHIDAMLSAYGDRYTYVNMRKHIGYYLKGVPGQRELKQRLYTIVSTEELKKAIDASLE